MQNFKLVVVGDGNVGKTSLLITSQTGSFPPEYTPIVFDNTSKILTIDSRAYNVGLWDTGGGEDYHKIRHWSYPGTDAFLVCFDVSNRNSFENIEHKWIPEIRHYSPDSVNILVGTKIDLRSNAAKSNRSPQDYVTYEEGRQLASRLGISTYLECSSLTQEGLDVVIPTAVRTAVYENSSKKQSHFSFLGKKIFSRKRDSASNDPFPTVVPPAGTNKEHVKEHRKPPLSFINDAQENEKKIGNTSKDSKCSVM